MPRGMDERFEDPSDEGENDGSGTEVETSEPAKTTESDNRETDAPPAEESDTERVETAPSTTESARRDEGESDEEPLNIREDWDSATIYVEPEQSEDMEITFTRLKKQLKREGVTLEKNKHFYRGIFEVAFGDHQEATKEKIRELAKQDVDQ